VDGLIERIGRKPDAVIPILQAIQEHYRYLPAEALERVCEISDITPARINGVSTFYTQFRHRPAGKHTIRVCVGTACHVRGAGAVHDGFCRHLDISGDADTDDAGIFTVEKVACLGCCSLAPVVQIGDVTYGHLAGDTAAVLIPAASRAVAVRCMRRCVRLWRAPALVRWSSGSDARV
jgi:NADH:ubiquinone oxidoreductase subunit E